MRAGFWFHHIGKGTSLTVSQLPRCADWWGVCLQITLRTRQSQDVALELRVRQAVNNNKMARELFKARKQKERFEGQQQQIENILPRC